MPTNPDLSDARWFPYDLHVPDRRYSMLYVDEGVIERSSFVDTRIEQSPADAVALPVAGVGAGAPARVAWLFHTSFCASTLLARALHVAPWSVCLKEPLVLRRLSDARHARWSLDGLIEPTVRLLARPWQPGGMVVIKPTHVALNVAPALLKATPGSKAVIVTCSLDEFLISNLKKPPDSQAKVPVLVDRALRATTFGTRLPPEAHKPPDLLCAVGLQWAATRELMHDVIAARGDRIRAIDMRWLQRDPPGVTASCARWLELPVPADRIADHAAGVATRNAKAIDVPYGLARYQAEARQVGDMFGDAVAHAHAWLDAHVLPVMRPQARIDPPPWPPRWPDPDAGT